MIRRCATFDPARRLKLRTRREGNQSGTIIRWGRKTICLHTLENTNMFRFAEFLTGMKARAGWGSASLLAGVLAIGAVGCESLSYRGVAPTFRTFADQPTRTDYYVGMDLKFAVLDWEDEKRLEAARARAVANGEVNPLKAALRAEKDPADPNLDKPRPVQPPKLPD